MNLAARVRRARKFAGFTQAEMARRLGVHRSCVGHWEGVNNSNPGADKLAGIATLCVVSYEWLATGRGTMKLGHDPAHDIPAVLGKLVDDPQTIRLLEAWDTMSQRARVGLLEFAEEMAALRQPRRLRSGSNPSRSHRSH